MSNLAKRVLTAVVLVAVLGITLFIFPAPAAKILFAVMFLIAAWEWSGFFAGSQLMRRVGFIVLIVVLVAVPDFYGHVDSIVRPVLYIGVMYWGIVLLALFFGIRPFATWATALAGIFALVPAWYAIAFMVSRENGPQLILWFLVIISAADIGAYFIGHFFGRIKLAPDISPGKTLEGLLGGLFAASLIAAFVAGLIGHSPYLYAVMGLAVGAMSVVGDLWVSRFKRAVGLKDTGKILPGHGGIMDRIDGLVAAFPLFTLIVLRTSVVPL